MRDVVELSIGGARLVGTVHRPDAGPVSRTGVLLFNAGHVPRDGHGGLSVQLAERLAAQGHPTWRFDFPGFGDSPGELPERIEVFWGALKKAALVPLALGVVDALRGRGEVDGLVIGGVCGAAITAIYAADRDQEGVQGLLMLEPEFFLTDEPGAEPAEPPTALSRITSTWSWLRVLTGASRFGRRFPRLRRLALDFVTRHIDLPERTNLELARAWGRVLHSGLPTMVVTARGHMWEVYYRQVTERMAAGAPMDHVRHVSLEGANHVFTTEGPRAQAVEEIAGWTADRFPAEQPRAADGTVAALAARFRDSEATPLDDTA